MTPVFFLSIPSMALAAERAETEALIRRMPPPITLVEAPPEAKDKIIFDSYYEPSDILQGSRTGHWTEITNRFGYTHGKIHGYMSFSEFNRFDDNDYTGNLGLYVNAVDSYFHGELGFGWDIDYIYKFQSITEYGHKLIDTLFWQMGYSYRDYGTDDIHMVYPGLIYYFGNSYIGADYGISCTTIHDVANFGALKGSFAITDFLQLWGGLTIGERLYDIFELEPRKEFGYVLFTGLTLKLYKGISFRAGCSYGKEKPKFIKRSLNFGLSVKF